MHGLEVKQTYYLKGASRSGKSALALNICDQILEQYPDEGVGLYFTLESDRLQLNLRRISSWTRIPLTRLQLGNFYDGSDVEKYDWALQRLPKMSLQILDRSVYQNFERIASYCENQVLNSHIAFVVIDFLQLCHLRGYQQSRHLELSKITNLINALAKDLNCPILVLSQLNKEQEAKESRDIENNASHVWLITREPEQEVAEIRGEKGKNIGTWGPVQLRFNRYCQWFKDERENHE